MTFARVERLASIQVLRAIAALAVVHSHTTAIELGAFGVDLFFVISGFVITLSARGKTAGQFLFDRAWRIYPIYWVAVAPWLLFMIYAGSATGPNVATSLSLWPVYGHDFSRSYLLIAWTLGFEMLFYLAMTATILLRSALPALGCFIGAMTANLLYPTAMAGFLGSPMILEFLIGVALANAPRLPGRALALLPLAIGLLYLSPVDDLRVYEYRPDITRDFARVLWWGIPAAIIFYAAICHEKRFTGWCKPLLVLGAASYSIYLFHMLVTVPLQAHWFVETVAAAAVGVAAWWLLERRIIAAKPRPGSPTALAIS